MMSKLHSPIVWWLILSSSGMIAAGREMRPVSAFAPIGPVVILNGDFPDPSILRDGDDFYMTHSSRDYVPGLLIWHSKDLEHWTPIARALRRHLGNVWAPDLIKHRDLFYIYFPAAGTNWVITAKTPYGPWSDPVDLKIRGIDPGHIATPDGERYLHVSGGRAGKLAPDGLSVVGTPERVYNGWEYPADWVVQCFCLESPKLVYREGYYYLTSAQGGTSGPATSHMAVAARSRNPLGPWENSPYNPIVHTYCASEPWWSKGHATLFDSADGRWWVVYHAYKNGHRNLGRYTLLEPVEWTADGWFRTAPSPGGHTSSPPIVRNHRISSDDFSGSQLPLHWQFSGIQSTAEFEIRDKSVRFQAQPDRFTVLHTQAADHNYEATVRLEIGADAEAGLILFYGPDAYTGAGMDAGGFLAIRRNRVRWRRDCADCRYLKIRLVNDDLSTYYSTDGVTWRKAPTDMEVSGYQPNILEYRSSIRLGIYGKGRGQVSVRNFTYKLLP